MLNLATVIAALVVAVVILVYVRILQGTSYSGGVPRLGKPGVWGYISTALRWTIDAESVILEGRSKFSGRPYTIPTLASNSITTNLRNCTNNRLTSQDQSSFLVLNIKKWWGLPTTTSCVVNHQWSPAVLCSNIIEQFNEPMAVNEDLQLPYTMDVHQLRNPYQASVLRTDVNRAVSSYIPEILDESILAMDETFKISKDSGEHLPFLPCFPYWKFFI